ncbi:MAG TPA: hypothetical protein VK044_10880 [Virgibacillus sp.]|nr:hypothetical protein [Virgibacillus sp.]
MRQAICGILLWFILSIPPIVTFLESIMVLHMLVQLPALIFVGWLIGKYLIARFRPFFITWNENGVPGMLVVVFLTTYWMLPRVMDEALTIWYIELFKFISLPVVGLFFRDSWGKMKTVGKSFLFFNYLSMFGLMAWLYIDTPIQICNNYLEIEQHTLGWGFLIITAVMGLYIVQIAFTDQSEKP